MRKTQKKKSDRWSRPVPILGCIADARMGVEVGRRKKMHGENFAPHLRGRADFCSRSREQSHLEVGAEVGEEKERGELLLDNSVLFPASFLSRSCPCCTLSCNRHPGSRLQILICHASTICRALLCGRLSVIPAAVPTMIRRRSWRRLVKSMTTAPKASLHVPLARGQPPGFGGCIIGIWGWDIHIYLYIRPVSNNVASGSLPQILGGFSSLRGDRKCYMGSEEQEGGWEVSHQQGGKNGSRKSKPSHTLRQLRDYLITQLCHTVLERTKTATEPADAIE